VILLKKKYILISVHQLSVNYPAMKKPILPLFTLVILITGCRVISRDRDSVIVKQIFSEALTDTTSYRNLRHLCTKIGGRICGSPEAAEAVQWSKKLLEGMDLDTVYLQDCMVRHWVRGEDETVTVNPGSNTSFPLHACAIGGSVGTDKIGITAKVIEVKDFDELEKLGRDKIEGRIVFFNHPADPSHYYTFSAYGEVAAYRVSGATRAVRFGAIAVVVRSATLALDDNPHTGIMHYPDSGTKIPAVAIGTNDADKLSFFLKQDPELDLLIRLSCREYPEIHSGNVIGEIRGSDRPEEVIAFGGHIDAWDKGQGAHDDGVGVIQTIEVLRIFRTLGIKPRHTLRVVVFMDEEVDQRGAKVYAENAIRDARYPAGDPRYRKHIAAVESDRGGFTPFGFSIDASQAQIEKIRKWKDLLLPYGIYMFDKGGSGVDIGGLKPLGIPLIALVTDSQRYFDYQHAATDTFDKVNRREMQLGSAAIAALVWMIDQKGF
jgi:hypothetical protein